MRLWSTMLVVWMSSCVVYTDDLNTKAGWGDSDSSTWAPASQEGQLEVDWLLGSSSCEEAQIASIEIDLGGTSQLFDCAEGSALATAPTGQHDLILRGLDADGIARYEGDGGRIRIRPGLASNDLRLLRSAAEDGRGVALMPSMLCEASLRSGLLVPVLPEILGSTTHLSLVYPDRRYLKPAARAFVDHTVGWMARWLS